MLSTLFSYLIFAAVVGILTLGFGSLLDILRGHDGKTAKEDAPAAPEAPAAPAAPESPSDGDEG